MTDTETTDLLFVRQDPQPAHLAMVFGAASDDEMLGRVRRNVELYHGATRPGCWSPG